MNTLMQDLAAFEQLTHSHDPHEHHEASSTHYAIEAMRLHGVRPERGERDWRDLPEGEAIEHTARTMQDTLLEAFDGTRLEDDLQEMMWGMVNVFHRRLEFIDKLLQTNEDEQRQLVRDQDGSEIRSVELERKLTEGEVLLEKRAAFELLRDASAAHFDTQTGSPWMPRSGSRTSHAGLTSAVIDSRNFQSAKRRNEIEVHCPEGTRIGFTGGKDFNDHNAVIAALDKAKAKYPDMVLLHGGTPKGAEMIAAKWCEANKVAQVVFKPDWTKHAKAAPFRRNDVLLKEMPIGVIAFPGSGVNENLADKAKKLGITVMEHKAE